MWKKIVHGIGGFEGPSELEKFTGSKFDSLEGKVIKEMGKKLNHS